MGRVNSLSVHLPGVLILAMLLSTLSLAVYGRSSTRWITPGEFPIKGTHMAFGMPPWLVINRVASDGPVHSGDLAYLPGAELYRPGVHVRPLSFLASAAICFVLAVPLAFLVTRIETDAPLWLYLIPLILGAAVGSFTPTDPQWVGVALALIVLPSGLIIVAALGRSYVHAALAAIGMVACLWAAGRIADLFRAKHLVHGMPDEDDLMTISLFGPIALLIAFAATCAGRFVMSRRSR
jgi:hypothetical protein